MRNRSQPDRRAGVTTPMVLALAGALVVAVALGLGVAFVVTNGPPPKSEAPAGAEGQADASSAMRYVSLGSTVVNLAGGRMTRYLQMTVSLEVKKDSAEPVGQLATETQKAVFKNWLITYLSDKRLEEVEGSASIRRLQREIQDGFNAILAAHGPHRVESVLFEEYNVQ